MRLEISTFVTLLAANVFYWHFASAIGLLDDHGGSLAHLVVLWAPAVLSTGISFWALRAFDLSLDSRMLAAVALGGVYWVLGLFGPFVVCIVFSGNCK
jgi:hypothetical protein